MKKVFGILISSLILQSSLSFASPILHDFTEVECEFSIDRPDGETDVSMKGYLRLDNKVTTGSSYLTLEPVISIGIPITARVLLTRFDSSEYFPMSLHPRGDTAFSVSHTTLQGKENESLSYSESGSNYLLTCKVLEKKILDTIINIGGNRK